MYALYHWLDENLNYYWLRKINVELIQENLHISLFLHFQRDLNTFPCSQQGENRDISESR